MRDFNKIKNYAIGIKYFIILSTYLLPVSLSHAEMTPFGERVDSSSTPDSSLSSLPSFPSIAPSPTPTSAPQPQASPSPRPSSSSTQKDSGATVAKTPSPSKPTITPTPIPIPTPVKLIEKVVKTGQPDQPEIHFFLRLPEGHTLEHPTAKGVLGFCTWQRQPANLRVSLLNEKSPHVEYAKRHNLAILTWNTAILWKSRENRHAMTLHEETLLEDQFGNVARAWESGAMQLAKEQGLPQGGWFLDGLSAGAHWSERLAIKIPSCFLAVHIHVANNYIPMQPMSLGPLWLVSSGDLDLGRASSEAFYRSSQKAGFPIILKICNGLGHKGNHEIDRLRDAFFNYASGVAQRSTSRKKPAAIMLEDLASSGLTGDLLTQMVFRGNVASRIPPAQRVALPDERVAKAWGYLSKK
jgi:hypothetical protein